MPRVHRHSAPETYPLHKAFIGGIVINLSFVITEFLAGYFYNSIGLLSDAGHNLSDVATLLLSLFAYRLSHYKSSTRFTYGYKKSTILISLLNAVILLFAVGFIVKESIQKFSDPQPIDGGVIAWVAGIGVLVNGGTALLFIRQKEKDLNVKGAYLHMAADALVSIGVLISGVIISYTDWYLIDPIIGLVVAAIILYATWNLLHESIRLSMDGVPTQIDTEKIRRLMKSVPGVSSIHHLHIWALSTTENALTAHIVVRDFNESLKVKQAVRFVLSKECITHVTLEFELENEICNDFNKYGPEAEKQE